MELKIKYWSNSNPSVRVIEVVIDTCVQLKETINRLVEERPDIDNVEIFRPGEPKPWTSIFNIRQKMHNRQ